jgi:2-haloacid dehalogenase
MSERLQRVQACVFDAYGTLFDVRSAALRCRDLLGERAAPLATLWREKQIQYTWLRTAQARHVDFEQVTRDALAFTLEAMGIEAGMGAPLLDQYATLDAFPEVPQVLDRLRERGLATAILSNGTPAMLQRLVAHAGLQARFERVLSVEEVGAFKPHPAVYRLACERLGLAPQHIAFVSSNAWDAHAASAFGLPVVWCKRQDHAAERLPGAPDATIRDLVALPGLLAPRAPPA